MATRSESRATARGRRRYRFTADQVLRMRSAGILADDEDVELWDGVLYRMVKGELHNYVVSQAADLLRARIPEGYHVREEKSCRFGDHSLPEPDAAVCRGRKHDYLPDPPQLSRLALVVEVALNSLDFDAGPRLRRYAEVGIPVYWLVRAAERAVQVFAEPAGGSYGSGRTWRAGDEFEVEIDGAACGRLAVADLFPPGPDAPG